MCLYQLAVRAGIRIGLVGNIPILVRVSAIIHTAEHSKFCTDAFNIAMSTCVRTDWQRAVTVRAF